MIVLVILEALRRQVRSTLQERVAEQRGTARNLGGAPAGSVDKATEPAPCRCGRYYVESFTVNHWVIDPTSGRLEFSERTLSIGRVTQAEKDRWIAGHQSSCVDPACHGFGATTHGAPSLVPDRTPETSPAAEGEAARQSAR
jgi:hypothetical protein